MWMLGAMHSQAGTMTDSNPADGILSLTIKDRAALQAAYMPFIRNGGLFVPSARSFALGDEVFLLLRLMDDPARVATAGKVVWVTPPDVQRRKPAGVGVQFNEPDSALLAHIKNWLGDALDPSRETHAL